MRNPRVVKTKDVLKGAAFARRPSCYSNPPIGRIQQYSIDWNQCRGRAPSRHSTTWLVTRPVPGKPCAGQRLFISGRRKVNARTRRGGERVGRDRNRNPIGPAAAPRLGGRTPTIDPPIALSRDRCRW